MDLSAAEILALLDLERLPYALTLIALGWLGLTLIVRLLDDLGERFTDRRLYFKKVKALMRFGVYGSLGLMAPYTMLQASGREALIPLFATFGLGLGFALKDVVASLMSGVLLLIDEPFQVGDRVNFGGYYGEVTEIGLRSVRLVTLDDNLVTIPNSKFLTDAVASANAGALDCMVVVKIHISPDADFDRARAILHEVAATSTYVFLDKPIEVLVSDAFHSNWYATTLTLKAYVFDARYEEAFASDVTARAKRALRAADISSPSPRTARA